MFDCFRSVLHIVSTRGRSPLYLNENAHYVAIKVRSTCRYIFSIDHMQAYVKKKVRHSHLNNHLKWDL